MKTNSLLTYLLYALLAALISVACYKACQMKKEKAEKAQEEAELQKTLRDMGYATDSTATSYTNGSDSSAMYTSPAPDANGIVDAPKTTTVKTVTTPKTTTTTAKPASTTTTRSAVQTPSTTTSTPLKTTSSSGSGLTAKSGVSKVKGPGTGKYSVRAGTFSSKERARTQLESVIKMGYQTAEVSPTKNGYWTVLILRTNDRSKATKMVDQLVAKGIDAALF